MLYLLRHLPTAWNLEGRLQGRHDESILPVDENECHVIEQLHLIRTEVEQLEPWDDVFASGLRRTQETAVALGFDECTVDPLLDEFDFGPFEGLARADLIAHFGPAWHEDPRPLVLGESIQDLQTRICSFLSRPGLKEGHNLVIGHGAWIRGLLAFFGDGHMARMNQIKVDTIALNIVDPTALPSISTGNT